MGPLALAAWLLRLALATAVACAGGALWILRAYDLRTPPAPELCPCVSGEWDSLDARWERFAAAVGEVVKTPCLFSVSAANAAVGHLAAWLFGRRTFRCALDEAFLAGAAANYHDCGCARGRAALVPVVRVGPGGVTSFAGLAGARAEGVCPSLVAQSPFRFIRAEALAAARAAEDRR